MNSCACGCGKPTKKTYAVGHGNRQSHVVDEETGCWIWQGTTSPSGYGVAQRDGIRSTAHRFYWEKANGRKVPEGLTVHHLCYTPPCVNPDHLTLATVTDQNRMRRNNKLSLDYAREIGELAEEGLTQKEIAARFDISHTLVAQIVRGRAWPEVAKERKIRAEAARELVRLILEEGVDAWEEIEEIACRYDKAGPGLRRFKDAVVA